MKVICGSNSWKEKNRPLGIALGNFDGVHLGHQSILHNLLQTSRKKGWKSAVYTFDPHPAKILAPQSAPLLIQTLEQKLDCFEEFQMDFVIVEKFDPLFSRLSPEKFFTEILLKRLNAQGLWTGYDFTFGHKRSGNAERLKGFCQESGLLLKIKEAQFQGETLVSSTQIRSLIRQGEVQAAQKLLGRPFALIGKVVKGHGIGSQLGIHTANMEAENELLPKMGIYISETRISRTTQDAPRTTIWPSVTSVGFNPTFPGKGFSVETHLLGFEGNLRGKKIEVYFLKWLRNELTFPNAETLADQIRKDIEEAKKFHETLRHHRKTAGPLPFPKNLQCRL